MGCSTCSPLVDRKSTRLNSSHTVIYTLSYTTLFRSQLPSEVITKPGLENAIAAVATSGGSTNGVLHLLAIGRSEEHTSELQSHSDLHSFLHDALPISAPERSDHQAGARERDCGSRDERRLDQWGAPPARHW